MKYERIFEMKKILALVLSVVMLLSIMPMAYAKRATYSPEIEQLLDNYLKLSAYESSVYETDEQRWYVEDMVLMLYDTLRAEGLFFEGDYDYFSSIEAEGSLDEISVLNEYFKAANDEIEKKIESGEIVVVIYAYGYWDILRTYFFYGPDFDELIERAENFGSDKFKTALDEFVNGKDLFETACNQAEHDTAAEKMKHFMDLACACLDGNHPYGEYISDNNAIEDADGTKTATCDFCGATDTIIDEGTKLPVESASLFELIMELIEAFLVLMRAIIS